MDLVYTVTKDINEARREYKIKHQKDEYIQLMEGQIDLLISHLKTAEEKIIQLQGIINDKSKFVISDRHMRFLKLFYESGTDNRVSELEIAAIRKIDIMLEIAFSELVDNKYIVKPNVAYMRGTQYFELNSEKKTEVLRLIATNK